MNKLLTRISYLETDSDWLITLILDVSCKCIARIRLPTTCASCVALNKSEVKTLSKPKLNNPMLVEGLTNFEGLGQRVTQMLMERTKAVKFAELYSPHFPDFAIAGEDGLCHLPRYEFYTNPEFQPNIIVLTGSVQPLPEYTPGYYEVFETVFNYAFELGCKRFITFGNFVSRKPEREIYVASTSEKLSKLVTERLGGKLFSKGRVDGLIGMILGIAQIHGCHGILILGASTEGTPLETMSSPVFDYLLKVLEFKEK